MARDDGRFLQDARDAVTAGRRFCFVIMGFGLPGEVLDAITDAVCGASELACIRADQIHTAGCDRLDKLHDAIEKADLIVADLSPQGQQQNGVGQPSPNVYYEVGYAFAHKKPVIVMGQEKLKLPWDVGGIEFLEYSLEGDGLEDLKTRLQGNVRNRLRGSAALHIRDMLMPAYPEKCMVLVEPKPERPGTPVTVHRRPHEKRTFGDNLGVVGIFKAFGVVFGEQRVPQLITASRACREVEDGVAGPVNLYLIGSSKVNDHTKGYLEAMQASRPPLFEFGPHPDSPDQEDPEWQLRGRIVPPGDTEMLATPVRGEGFPQDNLETDYGIIVRGPKPPHHEPVDGQTDNPPFPTRMVTIMAGAHALGTGAACLAATSSEKVPDIQRLLGEHNLSRRDRTIWVLVRGTTSREDGHLDMSGVEIVAAGVYGSAISSEEEHLTETERLAGEIPPRE